MKHTSIFILLIVVSIISYCQSGSNQYSVGNFIIKVVTKNITQPKITVVNKAEPKRLLWQTAPGVALIGAATGNDSIRMHGVPMGSFTIKDTIIREYDQQSITKITHNTDQLVIKGVLLGKNSKVNYNLFFKLASANQLQYILTTEGPGSKDVNRLYLRFASPKDEGFYGFGEQLTYFNQKGNVIPILVQEHGIGRGLPIFTRLVDWKFDGGGGNPYVTGIPAPQYITSKLNSLFLENKEYSVFDLHVCDRVEIKLFSDTLIGRIIYGKTPLDLVREYTSYSGRMRALPDWVNNGAIVCTQHGIDTLKARVAQMDSAGVPLAALWVQDWTGGHPTTAGYQIWWNWQLSDSEYPGFKNYVRQLKLRNVRTMIYISPFLGNTPGHNNLFLTAEKNGYLVKTVADTPYSISNGAFSAGLVDLSNPKARNWLENIIHDNMIAATGASGWMADFGEALPFDAKLYNNAPASYWHNHFPEEWAAVNREAIMKEKDSSDFVFFNRSGFSQSPGQSTLFWLGDQMQTWDQYDGIKTAVVGMLSGGMSGFSLMHSDIGGYNAFGVDTFGINIKIARSKELLMRWEELNIFNAVYRTHEGLRPDLSAQEYTDNETLAHFARSAKMFKALSFYRRQLVKEAADSGYPVVRHPFIQFSDDPNTFSLRYQFMYGSEFMVAPVLDPGRTSVKLYLPKGKWVNLWTGETLTNTIGKWVTANAPIGKPVMFYQKGSKVAQQFIDSLKAANVYESILNNNLPDNATANNLCNGLQAKVYPNPAHDFFTVEVIRNVKLPAQLTITDVSGNIRKMQMMHSTNERVSIHELEPGQYVLKLGVKQENLSLKLIKQ